MTMTKAIMMRSAPLVCIVALLTLLLARASSPAHSQAAEPVPLPALADLAAGWNTIEPGGETICSRGTPYRFFVRPGRPEDVTIYFQGGGACWDAETCAPGGPFDDSVGTLEEELGFYRGIFDFADSENPLLETTLIFIAYCTGDVHTGAARVEHGDGEEAFTIHHAGRANASAALGWLFDQIEAPERVLITGSSAGAYGAIYHADAILTAYPAARAIVFGDAGVGVLPGDWPGLDVWATRAGLPEDAAFAQIETATFNDGLYGLLAERYPEVLFSQYTAFNDLVQISFFGLQGGDRTTWEPRVRASFERLQAEHANFRSYLGWGVSHTILPLDLFYTLQVEGVRFLDWFTGLLEGKDVPNVACARCTVPEFYPR
ncbi:MAG: pectin acetylesterase-family hydrolase [Aggregatilineales bacterium]